MANHAGSAVCTTTSHVAAPVRIPQIRQVAADIITLMKTAESEEEDQDPHTETAPSLEDRWTEAGDIQLVCCNKCTQASYSDKNSVESSPKLF